MNNAKSTPALGPRRALGAAIAAVGLTLALPAQGGTAAHNLPETLPAPDAATEAVAEELTIEGLRTGAWSARGVAPYRSTADGRHYTALTPDGRAVVKYRYADGAAVDTLLSLDAVTPEEGLDVSELRLSDYELSQDEERLLLCAHPEYIYRRSYRAEWFYYVIGRPAFKRIAPDKVQAATLAPDGRQIAYVRAGDIYITRVMTASIELSERRVTDDGAAGRILNGVPDWVYEEEFSMNSALAWSPDSKQLAYLKFDETDVPEYRLPTYKGLAPEHTEYTLYPGERAYKYPVAGARNSRVSVWTYETFTKKTRRIALPESEGAGGEAGGYVTRVRFTTSPERLAVVTLSRRQDAMRLYFAHPYSGEARLVTEDRSDTYINPDNMDLIQFYDEGFTWVSERSGWRHLYLYDNVGSLVRQLTRGDFDVTDVYGYDPATRSAYVQTAYVGSGASVPQELTRGIYRVDAKGTMHPLFAGGRDGAGCRGTHAATFSRGYLYMQHTYSDALTPPRVTLELVQGLRTLRTLEDNAALRARLGLPEAGGSAAGASSRFASREFFRFRTPEGTELNGSIIRPRDEGRGGRRHPLLMEHYSGPGSQQVLDRWQLGWEQVLAARGYAVACVDPRGTGGRGAAFERQTYMQLGVREAQDLLAAGRYVAGLPYVDPTRMALWGWSYGGYATLMALCAPQGDQGPVYRAGMAVAPVTDWRLYDSAYTERYMRRPQENADGYRDASVLTRAGGLNSERTSVLVVHGTADDNVHPQHTLELTEEWVQQGKDFDMLLYTNRDHSIRGGKSNVHVYRQLLRYLEQHLK